MMAIANPIAKKFDLARLRTNEACNGFEQSAFAGSIGTDQSHTLLTGYLKRRIHDRRRGRSRIAKLQMIDLESKTTRRWIAMPPSTIRPPWLDVVSKVHIRFRVCSGH